MQYLFVPFCCICSTAQSGESSTLQSETGFAPFHWCLTVQFVSLQSTVLLVCSSGPCSYLPFKTPFLRALQEGGMAVLSHNTELSGSYATLELPVEFGLVSMQIAELIEKSESQTL